ncbi:MAG: hypothetical protein HDR39_01545 [Treponema sp.]|nr:hypothetical protein [Treponema sp.]MBD5447414.1 hypothetical protein [Treponema sp.]MDE5614569.1 hypothetical protein [Treponemataceae bacterium]MDE6705204.1 hypothetical protein [Treponemataceae bacterium]
MADLLVKVQVDNRTDLYMNIQHGKVQTLVRAMKQKDWAFVLSVPAIEKIRHKYCILPVWEIDDVGRLATARRIGAYVFNFSLVEQRSMFATTDFATLAGELRKSREPFRGFVGPLPRDELTYRMMMINDELSIMPTPQ